MYEGYIDFILQKYNFFIKYEIKFSVFLNSTYTICNKNAEYENKIDILSLLVIVLTGKLHYN